MSDAVGFAPAPPSVRHGAAPLLGDDRVAIRAERRIVFASMAAVGDWALWWPGVRFHRPWSPGSASREPDANGTGMASVLIDGTLEVVLNPFKLVRMTLRARDVRQGVGWVWDVGGDVDATSEVWLEDLDDCVVVHHLVWPGASRRARSAPVLRRVMRQGMWSLKEHVQQLTSDRSVPTP
ncbi:MAG: hypothetical protein WD358_04880 [Nitriliruptoraceae bacterium]